MTELFQVNFHDGSSLEDLTFEESHRVMRDRPEEWCSVHSMDYMKNCDPERAKGKFKHGK